MVLGICLMFSICRSSKSRRIKYGTYVKASITKNVKFKVIKVYKNGFSLIDSSILGPIVRIKKYFKYRFIFYFDTGQIYAM